MGELSLDFKGEVRDLLSGERVHLLGFQLCSDSGWVTAKVAYDASGF